MVYSIYMYGIRYTWVFFVKFFLVHLFWIQPSRHLDVFGGLNRLRKIRGKAPPWLSFLPRVFVRKKKKRFYPPVKVTWQWKFTFFQQEMNMDSKWWIFQCQLC